MSISSTAPLLFFRSLLSNPKTIGALLPSSPPLCQLMVSRVEPGDAPVLEVGAGTGAITRALLDRGVPAAQLSIIERDPALAAFLERKFPGVGVYYGDAQDAHRLLPADIFGRIQTVVSSVPLRNLAPGELKMTVRAMLSTLVHRGQLIQYTYAAGCPISSRRFDVNAECLGRVWLNVPPAAVWRFTAK